MGVSTRRGPRFFYGWVIAGVMAVVGGWTLSMGGANFGFFISPMRDELGFDRAFFGWASTARLYGGALGGIYIGRLLDVRGPRFVLALFGGIGAALVASLGFVSAEWQLIFIFGVIGLLGMQGSANIYTSAIVAKWFVRRRTRAMALMYLGVPTTLIVAFPLTQLLIDQLGWRGAWATLGLVGVAIIVPSSLLLLRREPEDMGLRPDGDPPARPRVAEPGEPPRASASDERSWTRREALRSWAFWRLTLAFGLHMMAQQSVSLYRFPHYEDQGIAPSIVSFAASMEGVASIAGALLVGPLIARHGTQRVTSLGFICMAVSHILTITTTSVAHVVAAIAVFGLGVSFLVMGQNLLYPLFFGRRHIGAIRGIGLSFTLAVAGLSGPATGFIADRTGSFNYIWWPMVTILVVSSALIFTAKAPTYRDAGAAPERAQAG